MEETSANQSNFLKEFEMIEENKKKGADDIFKLIKSSIVKDFIRHRQKSKVNFNVIKPALYKIYENETILDEWMKDLSSKLPTPPVHHASFIHRYCHPFLILRKKQLEEESKVSSKSLTSLYNLVTGLYLLNDFSYSLEMLALSSIVYITGLEYMIDKDILTKLKSKILKDYEGTINSVKLINAIIMFGENPSKKLNKILELIESDVIAVLEFLILSIEIILDLELIESVLIINSIVELIELIKVELENNSLKALLKDLCSECSEDEDEDEHIIYRKNCCNKCHC